MQLDSDSEFIIEDDEMDLEDDNELLPNWKVVIVDDDPDIHLVTRFTLKNLTLFGRKLLFLSAESGSEAFRLIQNNPDAAVALVDVVMEHDHAGLELIKRVREELKNQNIRLFLRTGQPGHAEEESVSRDYDINGYLNKSELTSARLASAVYTALRSYHDLITLKQRSNDLIEALEKAKSADRVKIEFLSRMSHEMRNPLQSVIGFINLALKADLDEKSRGHLQKAVLSANRLVDTMTEVLEFSDLDLGTLAINSKAFDLKELTDRFLIKCTNKVQQYDKNLQINNGIVQLHPVHGDAYRIEQIMLQLFDNAIKFTGKNGTISLDLSFHQQNGQAGIFRFSVKDNGIGIPATRLEEIFEPFHQLDGSTTRKQGGTGIGLFSCKKLLELMKGEIHVDSEEGKGSLFVFTLPMTLT